MTVPAGAAVSFDRPGAVPARDGAPDQQVPWHYGDPLREQRRLAAGTAAVDLSHWAVVEVAGADRLDFLDALTSQRLAGLTPPDSRLTLVLSPHGHVEHVLRVVAEPERLLVIVDTGVPGAPGAGALLDYLTRMVFLREVTLVDRSAEFGVVYEPVAEVDPDLPSALIPEEFSGRPVPDRGRSAGGDPIRYVPHRPGVLAGREVIVPRTELADRLAGWEPAGTWALTALRVAAGIPRLGLDTDERTLPHEVGWVGPAVHLEKGCYRGQETVARVHNLGRPPRRLVLLHLDGTAGTLPVPGDPVTEASDGAGAALGFVGTVVQHYEAGPIALAVVRSGGVADGAVVRAGTVPATVAGIVVAERAQPGPRPPRLGR